ncbi:MAG: guanylate kinase [Eubacterium sp.]|nr:guanylate kinase [Eubacterium sp.]
MSKKGMLVILSAPSGCGKDTVFNELLKRRDDVVKSVSATTRAPRGDEVDGVSYYFKTEEEFQRLINGKGLLEYTVYNGCYYGTPVEGVEKAINDGKVCFLIIEVEGGQNIMKLRPEAVSIFLLPPSLEVLEHRLNKRNTNDYDDIKRRLEFAEFELNFADLYKYNVVNDDLERCVNKIEEILNYELEAHNR